MRFLKLVKAAKTKICEISVKEVIKKLRSKDPFYFIDVREESEWNQAHAWGALHLSRGILEREIEKTVPDLNAEIVLYCGGGFRSALAAESLQKMGYRKVHSLRGGWRAWLESKGKIEE